IRATLAFKTGEIAMRQLTVGATLLVSALTVFGIGLQAAPLPPVEPDQAGFSINGLRRMDDFFDREIKQSRVPGAVVAIARDGKLVYLKAHGYRDRDKGLPMQIDSIFGLASMTKPMTAVGILSLTEQGKLPLFSPLIN